MLTDPATIIALLTALGAGSTLSTILTRALDRGKNKADLTAVLSKASGEMVTQYQNINASLVKELTDARSEISDLRGELRTVEDKMDEVIGVIEDERNWATKSGHKDAPVLKIVTHHI